MKREKEGREACGAKPLPAGEIEIYVLDQVRSWAADPFRARQVHAEAVAKLDEERDRLRTLLSGLESRLSRVRDALERLRGEAAAVGEGSQLWARVEGMEAEEAALVRERTVAEENLLVVDESKVEAAWVAQVLEGLRPASQCRPSDSHLRCSRPVSSLRSKAVVESVWEVMTPENRSRLVRLLVERVEAVAADGRVVITLRDPSGRVPREEAEDGR